MPPRAPHGLFLSSHPNPPPLASLSRQTALTARALPTPYLRRPYIPFTLCYSPSCAQAGFDPSEILARLERLDRIDGQSHPAMIGLKERDLVRREGEEKFQPVTRIHPLFRKELGA